MSQEQLILSDNLIFIPYDDTEELTELQSIHAQLHELNELSMELCGQASLQREKVSQVITDVDISEMAIRNGTHALQEAKKLSSLSTIIIGSAIGGLIIGGPVGLLIGVKTGTMIVSSLSCIAAGTAVGGVVTSNIENIGNIVSGAYSKLTEKRYV